MATILDGLVDRLNDDDAKQEEKLKQAYRSIFTSEMGRLVLLDMLWELKFLDECEGEQDMALSNYAKRLIAMVYGNQEVSRSKLTRLFRELLSYRRKKK